METFLTLNSDSSDVELLCNSTKSIITYDREYYASFDEKVRVTIDQNLKTFIQDNSIRPNLNYYRPHIAL